MTYQNIANKIKLLINSLYGNLLILPYAILGTQGIKKLEPSKKEPQIVISLTSYGKRVTRTVFYTIISMLKQNKRPDRILLWLDNSWNINTIPRKLHSLCNLGVEIYFCKDIRSYKKLIPTLAITQNDIIITIDDDVYYSSRLIETLHNSYLKQPQSIHCTQAMHIKINPDGTIAPYKKWTKVTDIENCESRTIFPIGEGGILYPPNSLYAEVDRDDIFQKLCPHADDIWFWSMAKLNNRQHFVATSQKLYYSFDAIYQYFHPGTALTHSNRLENQNDIQMKNILKHYPKLFHYIQ